MSTNLILFLLDLTDLVSACFVDDNTQLLLNGIQLTIMVILALRNCKLRVQLEESTEEQFYVMAD